MPVAMFNRAGSAATISSQLCTAGSVAKTVPRFIKVSGIASKISSGPPLTTSSAVAATAGLTAAGSATHPLTGASLAGVATVTATARVTALGGAIRATTATVAAGAVASHPAGAALAGVVAIAASGTQTAGTVTPDQIANLAGWYKADAITGLTNGAAVASWPDSSSNGLTGTQNTAASQPTYQTGVVNGKPVVRFDGSNDLIESGVSASATATTSFAVIKPANTTGQLTIRGAFSGSNSGGLQWRVSSGKQLLVAQFVAQIGSPSTTTLSTTSFQVVAATLQAGAGGSYAFYLNGAADGSGSTTQTLTASMTTLIGAGQGGVNELFSGDIAELIFYSAVLSSTDLASVTAYLVAKYGITSPGSAGAIDSGAIDSATIG